MPVAETVVAAVVLQVEWEAREAAAMAVAVRAVGERAVVRAVGCM